MQMKDKTKKKKKKKSIRDGKILIKKYTIDNITKIKEQKTNRYTYHIYLTNIIIIYFIFIFKIKCYYILLITRFYDLTLV